MITTPTAPLSKADYARAERFLHWNKERYVVNADIQPHWIGTEDRFWYRRTNEAAQKEFVVVDASSGERAAAFDQRKLADALTRATGKRIEPGNLPFSSFCFTRDKSAIEFQVDGSRWNYELDTCVLINVPPRCLPHEKLSPDGKWAAFVKHHNIWIRPCAGGESCALTEDGIEHYAYGVMAEMCLRSATDRRRAKPLPPQLLWSPDSRYVLTHRVDERKVKDQFLIQSVPEDGSVRPKLYTYRYPMPGDDEVTMLELTVLNLAARRRVAVSVPPVISMSQTPIETRSVWWSADSSAIYYLDRHRFSKSVALKRADVHTGEVREIIREFSDTIVLTSPTNQYECTAVRTLTNGDVIWYSRRSGWGHLYYYDRAGVLRNPVTGGEWLVRGVAHVDEAARRIYFTASGREEGRDPYEQRLYRINFDGSGMRLLTPEEAEHEFPPCPLDSAADDPLETQAAKARISPSGRYFVASYSRCDVPPVLVLRDTEGRLIRKLEEADISKLRASGYTSVEPYRALAADGVTPIYGNLFRPSGFDPTKKYPVIDANYHGPQSPRTVKTFTGAMFDREGLQDIAELGFIVVTIDGRGTPWRSTSFTEHSYGRMDKASDFEDHVACIRQLAQRYPYIDLDRVGIYGTSGGGYGAALAILRYPEFYKVAVAAEGDYDQSAYCRTWGEIYIGPLVGENYALSAAVPDAGRLAGKLLLMHGELDDNVSPAQTLKLVDALIKANKDFDLLIMPNHNHETAFQSPYYIRRKWDYFVQHLLGLQPPPGYEIAAPLHGGDR